jgi:glutathione S-transferase
LPPDRKDDPVLTIYGRKSSFNVQKVMWLVGELGVEHRHIELGGSFGGLDTPEFLAKNPHGKVPVIDDDGTIVWESHAILRYLAAAYGNATWWSNDPDVRSQVDRWVDWSATTLQPDFLNGIFWGYYRTPEAKRDTVAVDKAMARTARHMQLLDQHLDSRQFMTGRALTLADVAVGTNLFRYLTMDIVRPNTPNVSRWFGTLTQRPAYKAHVMIPFDDLYGRLAF